MIQKDYVLDPHGAEIFGFKKYSSNQDRIGFPRDCSSNKIFETHRKQ